MEKKYYIVEKINQGQVNTTIKIVKALPEENGKKVYSENGQEYYVIKLREFCFENETEAKNKLLEIIEIQNQKELEEFKKSQEDKKASLIETITLDTIS